MLQLLELVLMGCVGDSSPDRNCTVVLVQHSQMLEQDTFMVIIVSNLCNMPSHVTKKFNTITVNGSEGF